MNFDQQLSSAEPITQYITDSAWLAEAALAIKRRGWRGCGSGGCYDNEPVCLLGALSAVIGRQWDAIDPPPALIQVARKYLNTRHMAMPSAKTAIGRRGICILLNDQADEREVLQLLHEAWAWALTGELAMEHVCL